MAREKNRQGKNNSVVDVFIKGNALLQNIYLLGIPKFFPHQLLLLVQQGNNMQEIWDTLYENGNKQHSILERICVKQY